MDTSKIIVALDNYSPYMAREIIAKYSQPVPILNKVSML